jgi:hypothetical protein
MGLVAPQEFLFGDVCEDVLEVFWLKALPDADALVLYPLGGLYQGMGEFVLWVCFRAH